MKRWLITSLAINFVLFALLLLATRPVETKIGSPGEIADTSAGLNVPIADLPMPKTSPAVHALPDGWQPWLDQLRAAGVPNKILARLVIADFEDRWEERQRLIQRQFENGELGADALTQAEAERHAELEKQLQAALGDDGFRQWDKENTLRDINPAGILLSDAETDALYQLRKTLLQQRQDLESASRNGEIDEHDLSEKLSAAQMQYESQVRTLLGEDRYAAMTNEPDLVSPQLRRALRNLQPNDEQFVSLLQAQRQWNQQRADLERKLDESPQVGRGAPTAPLLGAWQPRTYEEQLRAIDAVRDQAFQQVLGTNGFAAFLMEQDTRYQTMKHYATAWQLSDRDIEYLYRTLQSCDRSVADYRQQAAALEAQGQPVDSNSMQYNLRQFLDQMQQGLLSYLGNERFDKLKANNVLSWNNGL
jgi:hypothetical protein